MHAKTLKRNRGGFALPVAVLALVVVGLLVTAGFYMAQQETRIGVASQNSSTAFYIAEAGMNEVLANWSAATYSAIPLWDSLEVTGTIDQGSYTVKVHHLTERMYWLESEGEVTEGGLLAGAKRKAGVIAKIRTAWIDPPAALTTRGPVEVGGSALVNGYDSVPNGWDSLCAGTGDNKPGVMYDSTGSVNTSGSGKVTGDPSTEQNNEIDEETFLDYGDLTWDDLIELATIKLLSSDKTLSKIGPSVSGTACNTGDKFNWGEPYTDETDTSPKVTPVYACQDYFPLIHHPGPNVTINSDGRGQGILLVGTVEYNADGSVKSMTGNLTLSASFTFHGIIIVLGAFETTGGKTPQIYGGVLAGNGDLEGCTGSSCEENILGTSVVQYSSCAVQQAILNNSALAKARPILERSWVDLSSVSHN